VRYVISAEMLQERFGASADPQSWVPAYEKHCEQIDAAAREAYRTSAAIVI
jgi:hypothetical protein